MGYLPISLNGATSGAALLFPLACRPHQPPWLAPLHSAETRKGLYVAAQCQDLSHACDSGGGSERSAFACEKCNTLLGRWCEPSLDMGEATAEQGSNRHKKHTPCLLGSLLLQAMWRNERKKHNPHPARNSLLRKAGEKRGGVKCVFYSFSLTRQSYQRKPTNTHRVFCVFFVSVGLGDHGFRGQI